tara:strand:+ start:45 stop:188 length:144 start_codon:yes stop_codon:yes gene_type:complete
MNDIQNNTNLLLPPLLSLLFQDVFNIDDPIISKDIHIGSIDRPQIVK